jgi:hypothetical protein
MRNVEERSMKMHALLEGLYLNAGTFEFLQRATSSSCVVLSSYLAVSRRTVHNCRNLHSVVNYPNKYK